MEIRIGIWIGENESSKFWLGVLTELKNRGVQDVLIFSVDGLTGLKEAIQTAYPKAEIQRYIIHQLRNSFKYVSYKHLKEFARDFKAVYTTATEEAALDKLYEVNSKWGKQYPYATTHKVPAFAMIMGSSRAKYIEYTKRCDIYSLMRCMVNAFEYFGRVPKVVLTDRMKTVLIGMEAGNPLWNKRFEEFAADIGFIPKVCRPRRPQTKGKVERLVEYIKDNFLPGRQFKDIDDLNHQALEWCIRVDSRPHGTTGDIPLKALSEEPLLNLPAKEVLDKYRWETRKVTIDGFISYDGIRYGVPWQFSRKEVRVRVLQGNLEVYDGEVLITSHKLEYISGKIKWLKGQYQGLTEKNGYAIYTPYARQINICAVEARPLHIYDAVMGVMQNA